MSQQYIAMTVFVALAVVTSGIVNIYIPKILKGTLISATVTTVLYQVISIIVLDYLDPFFIIALIPSWFIAFGICMFVSVIFIFIRKITSNNLINNKQETNNEQKKM